MKGIILFCVEKKFKDQKDKSKEVTLYKLTIDIGASDYIIMWSQKPYDVDTEVAFTIVPDGNNKPKVKIV